MNIFHNRLYSLGDAAWTFLVKVTQPCWAGGKCLAVAVCHCLLGKLDALSSAGRSGDPGRAICVTFPQLSQHKPTQCTSSHFQCFQLLTTEWYHDVLHQPSSVAETWAAEVQVLNTLNGHGHVWHNLCLLLLQECFTPNWFLTVNK